MKGSLAQIMHVKKNDAYGKIELILKRFLSRNDAHSISRKWIFCREFTDKGVSPDSNFEIFFRQFVGYGTRLLIQNSSVVIWE